MLISLRVTQRRTEGARAGTTILAQPAKRAGASGRSQKSSPSHAGLVKWCRVTSGRHPPLDAAGHDRHVAVECGPVDPVAVRHHPGPLDAQAEAVAAEGGGPVEGLLGVVPEADGIAGRFDPPHLLPGQPVVGRLTRAVEPALHLVAGRGHPEQEAVGKRHRRPVSARSGAAARLTSRVAPRSRPLLDGGPDHRGRHREAMVACRPVRFPIPADPGTLRTRHHAASHA